jgi:hypothetical protein
MKRYRVIHIRYLSNQFVRFIDAANKREAIRIARDEYDDENKVRGERGQRIVTPLSHFSANNGTRS